MNKEPQNQTATRKPFVLRWLALGVLLLIGGTVVTALIGTFLSVANDGLDWRKLPSLFVIVIWVVLFFCLKVATNPIRSRMHERRSWKEQFPTHTDQEIERFLHVAGDCLGVSEEHLRRLRPDDRVTALTQEAFFGDGMDIIELVMAMEDEYALELPETFLEQARTLGELFDYVTRHGTGSPSPSATQQSDQPERD